MYIFKVLDRLPKHRVKAKGNVHIGLDNTVLNCLSVKHLCIFLTLILLFSVMDGFTFHLWALPRSEKTSVGEGVVMQGVDWRMTFESSFISAWVSSEDGGHCLSLCQRRRAAVCSGTMWPRHCN